MAKDFGVGFRYDIHHNPNNKEIGDGAVGPIICGFLLLLLIGGMFLFRYILGNSEPFLDRYSVMVGNTQSIKIHNGCYVYLAPITVEEAYVGSLSEEIVLHDVLTYAPTYKNYIEANSYIGIDIECVKDYLDEESDLTKDRDGIVWIPTHRIRTLP